MAPLILIQVDDEELDRAASFYARAFGLIVRRRLGPQVVELIGAEAPIHLLARPAAPPGDPRLRTLVQLDLVVEDIEAARERALRAGAELEGGVRDHAWGSIAQLADPFGNRVCLLSFRRPELEEAAAPWLPAAWTLGASGAAIPASRPEREAGWR